jgi:ABC-type branched-subunit amino acid transport system substrate-binding protein
MGIRFADKRFFSMKKFCIVFLAALVTGTYTPVFAQNIQRHKIALFAPLYLDSAFDAGYNYRFDKAFPKFLNAGLEFYQGAQVALDSLTKAGAPLEVFVYDSRSRQSLQEQVNSVEMKDVEMIIGQSSGPEVKILADAAMQRKIPFISATYPNDAGITNNPYYVILNSTLRTHVENIYRYLQKFHSKDRIIVFRKNGSQEDQIKDYLEDYIKNDPSTALKLEFENIGNSFDLRRVTSELDSNRRNICIAGSLDENFGMRIVQLLKEVSHTYRTTIIGMPTWDGLNFSKPEFKSVDIMYTTPFYYSRTTPLGAQITNEFESKINGRPTDMYFRGYETMLRFALLLLDTKKDIASNLTRKGNYIFTNFDIQPQFLNKKTMTLDYFENKKLYYVRIINGVKNFQN